MNHIAFDLRLVKALPDEPAAQDYFALDILVDDRDFLDYVREIERPFAVAEGQPDLAGKYEAMPADIALADLAGKQAEKVSLYDCECGCLGCWPLLVRISVSDEIITWSEFEQPHRGPESRPSWWRYDRLGRIEFDRTQYVAALSKAESDLRDRRRTERCI